DIPMFLEKIAAGYDIVSGWRKVRVDNFWMRRIPSRIANWMMARLSGVDIHDFGTTFKAYRRDILDPVPLYGELHRFIPALAAWRSRDGLARPPDDGGSRPAARRPEPAGNRSAG